MLNKQLFSRVTHTSMNEKIFGFTAYKNSESSYISKDIIFSFYLKLIKVIKKYFSC